MINRIFCIFTILLAATLVSISTGSTVTATGPSVQPMPTPPLVKVARFEYKGVTIGTTMDEARTKLGAAKETSDVQDYYVFSENETAQVLFDKDRTVKVISITFVGGTVTPPTPIEVLGVDAEVKTDGSINKIAKFPKAGYWISYLRTGGEDPMVMITIQKMQNEQQ